jgi:hypothetical protein
LSKERGVPLLATVAGDTVEGGCFLSLSLPGDSEGQRAASAFMGTDEKIAMMLSRNLELEQFKLDFSRIDLG